MNVPGAGRHFGESKYTEQRPESNGTLLSLTQYYSAVLDTLWGSKVHANTHSPTRLVYERDYTKKSPVVRPIGRLGASCPFERGRLCPHGARHTCI